jgi:hypothetical protein
MKILIDKYPMGSLKGQKSAGRYVNEYLYENLKPLAKKITDDHNWLAVISSSTLENGTGKSVFATQIMEAYFDLVNQYHGLNIQMSMKNMVFKPKDLITRAFEVPRYSGVIVDEWEDTNYWSELGMSLRQFFRKCRQLNLFIIIIIPNFFQLPMNYAISRSVFFLDVKFKGEFERGYFGFYSFLKKKDLYVKGKKTQDYNVVKPDFEGRFTDGYGVDEDEYRKVKLKDMIDDHTETKEVSPLDMKRQIFYLLACFIEKGGKITNKTELSQAFDIARRTGIRWYSLISESKPEDYGGDMPNEPTNTRIPSEVEGDGDEGEAEPETNILTEPELKINGTNYLAKS